MQKARSMTACIERARTKSVVDGTCEATWAVNSKVVCFLKSLSFTCIARRMLWSDTTI
jgi:hypothetical protein